MRDDATSGALLNNKERHVRSVPTPRALEFVEDAVVLVQVAEFSAKMVVNGDGPNRSALHVHVPDLQRQVVSR